ncbi:MAG: RNA polymerase sigma factor [Oscillospiraceae bacterium]
MINNKNIDIEKTINTYSDMIYKIALSSCKNPHNAEDITQDVLLKLITNKKDFESEEHLKAWLIRVTINQCNKLFISPWFQRTQPLDENISFTEQTHSDLYNAVMRLPKVQRVCVHLFYYEDYSTKEIAEILGKNESTIRSYLRRARIKLKSLLEEDIFNE